MARSNNVLRRTFCLAVKFGSARSDCENLLNRFMRASKWAVSAFELGSSIGVLQLNATKSAVNRCEN